MGACVPRAGMICIFGENGEVVDDAAADGSCGST